MVHLQIEFTVARRNKIYCPRNVPRFYFSCNDSHIYPLKDKDVLAMLFTYNVRVQGRDVRSVPWNVWLAAVHRLKYMTFQFSYGFLFIVTARMSEEDSSP